MIKNLIVTEDHVRPARPDGTCFYCSEPIGAPHKIDECVIPVRAVNVRISFDITLDYPAGWDGSDIEFHANESSSCATNLLRSVARYADMEVDHNDILKHKCLCDTTHLEYLGEVDEIAGPVRIN